MTTLFITSTGTEIGKTFVTAGLIRYLREAKRTVRALKPVATGYDPATAADSDPGVLLAALNQPLSESEIAVVSPWRFAAPLSPDMAARREGRAIDFDQLVDFCRDVIDSNDGVTLIEGIGGIMVPIDDRRTVLDWIAALKAPALLVAGSYLGTLSHTLTALAALGSRNISVKGIVVNETPNSTVPLQDTMETLRNFTGVPVMALHRPPRVSDFGAIAAAAGL